MVSTQLRRPEEQSKTEIATSNPVQTFYTPNSQSAVEVQFFVQGPRQRVEAFLRAYNDSHEPGYLSNLLRDYQDIFQRFKVGTQTFTDPREVFREVCRQLGVDPLVFSW
ncbi:MAG: hypothetical protein V1861_06320 [Candidatus Micrarchaeota archaeon]